MGSVPPGSAGPQHRMAAQMGGAPPGYLAAAGHQNFNQGQPGGPNSNGMGMGGNNPRFQNFQRFTMPPAAMRHMMGNVSIPGPEKTPNLIPYSFVKTDRFLLILTEEYLYSPHTKAASGNAVSRPADSTRVQPKLSATRPNATAASEWERRRRRWRRGRRQVAHPPEHAGTAE